MRELKLWDPVGESSHYKDSILASMAERWNVAQFVSFSPDGEQRHSAIRGFEVDFRFGGVHESLDILMRSAPESKLRVRSFDPVHHRNQPFTVRPLGSVNEVTEVVRSHSRNGLHTIVNESIDVNDGGVSGVLHGPVIEFAPGAVPRCVEEKNVCSLPRDSGKHILGKVYDCDVLEQFKFGDRVEFSVHPEPRGYRGEKYIVWEQQELSPPVNRPKPSWPNRFSAHIGDKVFGLLIADSLGFQVPSSLVLPRFLPPFEFGRRTCSGQIWFRTSPMVQEPGRFTTRRGWLDPFKLMMLEDPEGQSIASIIKQDGVSATYSGAAHGARDSRLLVEGVSGAGDDFMTAKVGPEALPSAVVTAVESVGVRLAETFEAYRFEWVYDGEAVWIVQLHVSNPGHARDGWIFGGNAERFVEFNASEGLEALRSLADGVKERGDGILVCGDIGFTSHICDVLRQLRVPSRLVLP